MFDQKRGKHPTAMRVEFAVVEGQEQRYRGRLLVRPEKSTDDFRRDDGKTHITIAHQFRIPAAAISVTFHDPVMEAALSMGVHQSTEWESMLFGDRYAFWFRCTPLFWPAST
jgi:hypothetical protein